MASSQSASYSFTRPCSCLLTHATVQTILPHPQTPPPIGTTDLYVIKSHKNHRQRGIRPLPFHPTHHVSQIHLQHLPYASHLPLTTLIETNSPSQKAQPGTAAALTSHKRSMLSQDPSDASVSPRSRKRGSSIRRWVSLPGQL